MRVWTRLVPLGALVLLAPACLPPLPPLADGGTGSGSDSGGSDKCHEVDPLQANEWRAENCNFRVYFDPANPSGIIDLRVGGSDNLVFDREDLTPEVRTSVLELGAGTPVAGWMGMPTDNSQMLALQSGPAVVRVLVSSETPHDGDRQLDMGTAYTVIADGRILRDETGQSLGPTDPISRLSAYTALAADKIPRVILRNGKSHAVDPTSDATADTLDQWQYFAEPSHACAVVEDDLGVVGFTAYNMNYPVGPSLAFNQFTAGDPSAASVVFHYDWIRDSAIEDSQAYDAKWMMHLSQVSTECDRTAAYEAAYNNPGEVVPGAGFEGMSKEGTGDTGNGYDSFSQGAGWYYGRATGGAVHMTLSADAAAQPTMLIEVADLPVEDVTGVMAGGAELAEEEYILQNAAVEPGNGTPEDGGLVPGTFVLIAVPVQPGDEIIIER